MPLTPSQAELLRQSLPTLSGQDRATALAALQQYENTRAVSGVAAAPTRAPTSEQLRQRTREQPAAMLLRSLYRGLTTPLRMFGEGGGEVAERLQRPATPREQRDDAAYAEWARQNAAMAVPAEVVGALSSGVLGGVVGIPTPGASGATMPTTWETAKTMPVSPRMGPPRINPHVEQRFPAGWTAEGEMPPPFPPSPAQASAEAERSLLMAPRESPTDYYGAYRDAVLRNLPPVPRPEPLEHVRSISELMAQRRSLLPNPGNAPLVPEEFIPPPPPPPAIPNVFTATTRPPPGIVPQEAWRILRGR